MSEDTLNKSIPFSDYVPIITERQESNDDAFYTSILPNTKTDDPIELYNYIKEEQREKIRLYKTYLILIYLKII